jgi:hypothetical protein
MLDLFVLPMARRHRRHRRLVELATPEVSA